MALPQDYLERVYAGVLGKLIGVYLGRPFEGWTHERIMAELGEVSYYVHERLRTPLIVTDDDISGTFTFLRALDDYGHDLRVMPAQIGQTWLNYIIEKRTILWWGGMGNSTEHTAYLRLKHGIPAPHSGAIATNGKVVAEQIGSQIFIDGWAMVAPGDPALAADLARRASSVSHDGEAIYGAQVIAAMESQAFVERDLNKLIDCAIEFIPKDSVIYRLIDDMREWREEIGDWRRARELLQAHYGYDQYGGNCHMVPNHGVIMLGLLYGDDDFQKSLMIANTAGWDTDCNSGNVGCLLGIKNGLAAIDSGPDWRAPVADRLYLPTADGGRAITDAASEAIRVVNLGRALAGASPIAPKNGARFHFALPGSVQGWMADAAGAEMRVENVEGHSDAGQRSLALHYKHIAHSHSARATAATFIPPEAINMPGYMLLASPTLYPGQTVQARLSADAANGQPVTAVLFLRHYGANDALVQVDGPALELAAGAAQTLVWQVPDLGGQPIAEIGIALRSGLRVSGTVYLDWLTWGGAPNVAFRKPEEKGELWRRAWVDGVDHFDRWWSEAFRVVQDEGTGLLMTGAREWQDYRVSSTIVPHMATRFGIAARVQGMRRFYALVLVAGDKAQLVKALDGETVLAEADLSWVLGQPRDLALRVTGNRIEGWVAGRRVFDVTDAERPLEGGGVALLVTEGRIATEAVKVEPAA
jgi:ADP-ribosylglycohydrolase